MTFAEVYLRDPSLGDQPRPLPQAKFLRCPTPHRATQIPNAMTLNGNAGLHVVDSVPLWPYTNGPYGYA